VPHADVEEQTEALRELVVAARTDPSVGPAAAACLARLNELYRVDPAGFGPEDVRFVNMLKGTLAARLDALRGGGPYAPIPKPKGVKLGHCWRCHTPLDERFGATCPACSTRAAPALVCPVCEACGCPAAGRVLC
jgi:hypothetical protein